MANNRLPFIIRSSGNRIAAFWHEEEACAWAKQASLGRRAFVEVEYTGRTGAGLIAQYKDGRSTPEFRPHEQARC